MQAALPDELWAVVFSRLPVRERLCTVPLVCKGWEQAIKVSGPAVWQACSFYNSKDDPLDFFKVLRWFGQHGKQVKSLSIHSPIWDKGRAPEEKGWRIYSNGLIAILAQTPHLESLDCWSLQSFFVPKHGLYIFKQLASLQSLHLDMDCQGSWKECRLQPLSHLTGLQNLSISVSCMGNTPLLLDPGLSSLISLTSLCLRRSHASLTQHATDETNLTTVLTNLTGLHRLQLSGIVEGIPCSFSHLQQLRQLGVASLYSAARPFGICAELTACSKLQILSLDNRDTHSKRSGEALVQMCSTISQLPSLTTLSICDAFLAEGSPMACSFRSTLTMLELECGLLELPLAVLQLSCLEHLSFWADADVGIGVPPVGPYLHNLTYLSLMARPRDVPSDFLLAARSLRCLSLHWHQEDIPDEEVEGMLPYVPVTCDVAFNERWWSAET